MSSAILAADDVCSLICRGVAVSGEGGGGEADDVVEFRRMGRDVTDGTRCRPQSLDMCIRGKCRVRKSVCPCSISLQSVCLAQLEYFVDL